MTAPPRPPTDIPLYAYRSLASTNSEARRLAERGIAGPLVVWTREQPGGRGRQGRGWAGPRGNLMMSLLVHPSRPLGECGAFSLVAALAVADCVEDWGLRPRIKWPNDVLVDGAKIAGILSEAGAGEPPWLVVGVGVNLAVAPELDERPTARVGPHVTPEAGLKRLAGRLDERYRAWSRDGFAGLREAWLRRALFRGETIRVHRAGRRVEGRFLDVDPDGSLVIADPAGVERRLAAGEISPVEA